MPKVIVIPETKDFEYNVSHNNTVWINSKLGVPKLRSHDVCYLAPFWVEGNEGVNRIYHITKVTTSVDCTVIDLGNSFIVDPCWTDMRQKRRFEYHNLADFGFVEVCPGIIASSSSAIAKIILTKNQEED